MTRFALALLAVTFLASFPARADVIIVDARTSIFSQVSNPSGSGDGSGLPTAGIPLPAGTGRVLTLGGVTGAVNPGAGFAGGADGALYVGTGVNVSTLGSISGVLDDSNRELALLAVFTAANPAAGSAPARLNFAGNHAFASLAPLLNQSFFVGDGLTGTGAGATQQFLVPDGASFLRFGFADAFAFSGTPFVGTPSSYQDNSGSLTVTYGVTGTPTGPTGPGAAAVPEPATLAVVGLLGAGGMIARRRRPA